MKNADGVCVVSSIYQQPRANTINFGASLGVRHVLPVTLARLCFVLLASVANSQSINSPVPVRLHSIIPLALRAGALPNSASARYSPRVHRRLFFACRGYKHTQRGEKDARPRFSLILPTGWSSVAETSPL